MLQEISRTVVPAPKNDEASLSWHNSILAVRTEKYIIFYEFARNLKCTGKKLDFIASEFPLIRDSPLDGLIPEKFTSKNVRNIDYTQMIVDPSLWPHNRLLVREMASIADMQWCPASKFNNQCVLAILNNVGNVNFLAKFRYSWQSVLDLSELIRKIYLSLKNKQTIKTMPELKDLADTLETSAIIWGPNVENGCFFVTAQKKGSILFWLLEFNQDVIKPQFLGEIFEPCIGEIAAMDWIQKTGEDFLLICSNVFGQIYSFDCSLDNHEIKVVRTACIWSHKDRMISKCMKHLMSDDKIVLFFNKHRHLLVQIIDGDCNILVQHFQNVNDHRITNIVIGKNDVFITTVNFKVYRISLILNDSLNFQLDPVAIDNHESYSTYDLQSITLSGNCAIWAVGAKDRKILHRQRIHKSVDIIFFAHNQVSEIALLLENPTGKFTDYWDCVELVRCKTMKLKALPPLDFDSFFEEADKDIYKLKLYLVFLHCHLNLEYQLKNKDRNTMPEISVDAVKEKILMLRACQVLINLFDSHTNTGLMMEEFQLKSYIGAKKFLMYYCSKYRREIAEFIRPEVLSLTKIEDVVECQSCDETLVGFLCRNGHLNMFCSLTFIPIEGLDYSSCQLCGCTYRSELSEHNPRCIFCDL